LIFNNLINNAIKYTDQGHIHYGYEIKENEIQFFVNDTGIGIEKKDQEYIFRHFYKIEKESKLYRGAGIGLAICLKLVENLGGRIWVESEINKGSSFKFTLPSSKEIHMIDKPKETRTSSDHTLKGMHILIADDEHDNYELIAKMLTPKGAILHWTQNGQETIDYLNNNNWPEDVIILMDIKMPVMDGYEATQIIKNNNI